MANFLNVLATLFSGLIQQPVISQVATIFTKLFVTTAHLKHTPNLILQIKITLVGMEGAGISFVQEKITILSTTGMEHSSLNEVS